MSNCQKFIELLDHWIVSVACTLQKFVKVVKSLSQRFNFFMLTFNKNLHRDHFVSGEILRIELHTVVSISLGCCSKVTSFDCNLDVLIQVSVKEFRVFLSGFVKTIFPVIGFFEDFASGFVVTLFQSIPRIFVTFVRLSLLSVNVIGKFGVEFGILDHSGTVFGSFIISAFTVSTNSFFKEVDLFEKLSCTVKGSDLTEFGADDFDDFDGFVFLISNSQLNSPSPDLFEHLSVSEVVGVNLKIPFDGLGIVSSVVPSSCLLKFLFRGSVG